MDNVVRSITAAYVFAAIPEGDLPALRTTLLAFGRTHGMEGLVLIAPEGLNGTVCGSEQAIAEWKRMLIHRFGPIEFKDSTVDRAVFKQWSVKIKPEIVALKQPGVRPAGKHRHVAPEEWHRMLQEEDVFVLDTRNAYEYEVGKFRGAVDPGLSSFHEFPAYVQRADLPKDRKILMYCTGGIRCEKALLEMERQGYENVYQLDGGILAYLERFPDGMFEGECFVFDHRVTVDRSLQPSQRYGLCPHCGHAGDKEYRCHCGVQARVCGHCAAHEDARRTCSKRCANEARAALQPQ